MKYFFALLLLLLHMPSWASDWTIYPAVSSVSRVAIMHQKAYILCGSTLCVADTTQIQQYKPLTRLDGLTGTHIFDIRYSSKADCLAIVYDDGNIDIMYADGAIHNLPDYANHTGMGDHTINAIAVQSDSLLMQTGQGTLIIDLSRQLILNNVMGLSVDGRCTEGADWVQYLNDNCNQDQNMVKCAAQMVLADGRLLTIQSGHLYYGVYGGTGHISILDTHTRRWSQIYNSDIETNATKLAGRNFSFRNLLTLGVDPLDPTCFYTASEGSGICCFADDTIQQVLNSTTCPDGIVDILPNYCRVTALHPDEDGNLWYVCAGIDEKQLHCRTSGGRFLTMPIPGFTNTSAGSIDLMLTQHSKEPFVWLSRNYRWDEFGGAVYYRNQTDTILTDDKSVHFSSLIDQDGNTLAPQYLYAAIEDHDAQVWLLTSMGPLVVEDQVAFFNYATKNAGFGPVRRIKIPRNDGTNLADYLLASVECTCGLVDAANRKWIGTLGNGLYLLSEDGLSQIQHYTTQNSPLFSDDIQSLAYDAATGQLFVATEGGLCVLQTDAIQGQADNSTIYCYPNPVRPDYTGNLTIAGLMDQSEVRITDVSGHVIYATQSAGGMVTWDLCGNSGHRVRPGVYIIYGIDADGKEGANCKVLVQ